MRCALIFVVVLVAVVQMTNGLTTEQVRKRLQNEGITEAQYAQMARDFLVSFFFQFLKKIFNNFLFTFDNM